MASEGSSETSETINYNVNFHSHEDLKFQKSKTHIRYNSRSVNQQVHVFRQDSSSNWTRPQFVGHEATYEIPCYKFEK